MNEKTKDSDKEKGDRQPSPTDWDWMMFLSGEINAIETSSHAFANMFIETSGMAIVILLAFMGITYSNLNSTDPNIIITILTICIMFLGSLAIIVHVYRFSMTHNKRSRRDEDRVKLLKECRDELFDRLDDHNRIVERCFKKDDENK